jgi:hypothetical protein
MGTVRREHGPGRKAIEDIIKHGSVESQVGFFPSAHEVNGTPTAQVAEWMEYGVPSRSIPARPTARPAIDANISKWNAILDREFKKIPSGESSIMVAMEMVGLVAEGDWREEIINKSDPPLSPLTMMIRKYKKDEGQDAPMGGKIIGILAAQLRDMEAAGHTPDFAGVSDKPLNDTGAMLAQLTHMTVEK